MPTPIPRYDRAPSEELLTLLVRWASSHRWLTSLLQKTNSHEHDMHFRPRDEVHIYRGQASVLIVKGYRAWGRKGGSDIHLAAMRGGIIPAVA